MIDRLHLNKKVASEERADSHRVFANLNDQILEKYL